MLRFLVIVMIVVALPIISAYKTEVTVKTQSNMLVSIQVTDPSSDEKIFNVFERADSQGIFATNFSTGFEKVNIKIRSQDNQNVIIGTQEIENYNAGKPLIIDFVKESEANETSLENSNETLEITNETEVNVEELDNSKNETEPTEISGFFISKLTKKIPKPVYYGLGILLLVAIIGFFISRQALLIKSHKDNPENKQEIKIKKLTDFQEEQKQRNSINSTDERVRQAEEKIRQAQEEIKKIKNEGKIKEMESKLERDRQELEKLKFE